MFRSHRLAHKLQEIYPMPSRRNKGNVDVVLPNKHLMRFSFNMALEGGFEPQKLTMSYDVDPKIIINKHGLFNAQTDPILRTLHFGEDYKIFEHETFATLAFDAHEEDAIFDWLIGIDCVPCFPDGFYSLKIPHMLESKKWFRSKYDSEPVIRYVVETESAHNLRFKERHNNWMEHTMIIPHEHRRACEGCEMSSYSFGSHGCHNWDAAEEEDPSSASGQSIMNALQSRQIIKINANRNVPGVFNPSDDCPMLLEHMMIRDGTKPPEDFTPTAKRMIAMFKKGAKKCL